MIRLLAGLGHAAKQEKRDSRHRNAVFLRNHRVRKLMGQQRDEEQDARGERRHPDRSRAPVRMPLGKNTGTEAVDDQKENNDHADIESDLDTEYRQKRHAVTNASTRPLAAG